MHVHTLQSLSSWSGLSMLLMLSFSVSAPLLKPSKSWARCLQPLLCTLLPVSSSLTYWVNVDSNPVEAIVDGQRPPPRLVDQLRLPAAQLQHRCRQPGVADLHALRMHPDCVILRTSGTQLPTYFHAHKKAPLS